MKNYISLKNKKEFDNVFNKKNSYANKYLVMYITKNNIDNNRLGIIVSKKVGNSVVRHRITRIIRECYRLNFKNIKIGYDIVIIARESIVDKSYFDVESALIHLLKLHKIFLL